MFKKVIFNTLFQAGAKVITASSTLIITLLIGKSLGPAGYGDFTKIFTFVGYFYTFSDFGLNSIFVKISNKENSQKLFQSLVAIRLVLGLFFASFAVLISQLLPYNPQSQVGFSPLVKTGILIASFTIITQALFTTANALFQKKLRYDLSAISAIIGAFIVLSATVVANLIGANILHFSTAYVLGGITLIASSYFFISKKFKFETAPKFSKSIYPQLLIPAIPIGLALLFNLIYFRMDVFILSAFRSSSEVGLYGLAYQFFEAALALPIFISNALFPPLSDLYINSPENFYSKIKKTFGILLTASIGLAFFLNIISYFIPVFYDARFEGSKTALQILSLGMPFFFLSALLWHVLIIRNYQKLLAPIYFTGAILNISLNLFFIPKYGFLAAAYITVFSEAFITLLLIIATKRLPPPNHLA